MNKSFVSAALFLLLVFATESFAEYFDPSAILRVRTTRGSKVLCYGSGSVVRYGDARFFVTANHVVQSNPSGIQVRVGGAWERVQEVYRSRNLDFAIYTAPDNVPELFVSETKMNRGDRLFVCGFNGDGIRARTSALYLRGSSRFDCRGAAKSGDSGGPVLLEGKFVGIVTHKGYNMSRCTGIQPIIETVNDIVSKY